MLQFITTVSSRFSVLEEVQMVLEGGCRWIQLAQSGFAGDESAIRDVAMEIVPMCQEKEAFFIIEDDLDLVEEMKVHGLFMHDNSRASVMAARERLGANAVIGVWAHSYDEIKNLAGLDVDYVTVPSPEKSDDRETFYKDLVQKIIADNIGFHIVAAGEFASESLVELFKAGVAGVAMSGELVGQDNPVAATVAVLDELGKARAAADAPV